MRFVEGPCGCETLQGSIFQTAVQALCALIAPPVFDDLAGLTLIVAQQPMLVQAFFTVSAIETVKVGILGPLAGGDETYSFTR